MASATAAAAPAIAPSTSLPAGRLAGIGLIIFLANAALLVLQLVASRLLAPFVGSSLETWTSIIGVFLVGIALGNAYGGRIADRYPSPRTLAILLAVGAAAALWMVIFPLGLASASAYKSIPLGPRIPLLALVLCLPSGFVLSLLTPLAIRLGLPDVSRTGRVAGLVFALSTLGCLIGNYLTGFVLIPAFTINTLVFFAAGALAILSVVTLCFLKSPLSPGASDATPGDDAIPRSANPHAFPDIRLAYAIVFLASFCGMTLELTASRVLAQYLGVSLFTWTGIIGVMLAGTALGNFTGGLFADRANQPGGMRGPLACLTGIIAFALVFGFIDKLLPWVSASLSTQLALSGPGLAMVAVVLALLAAYGAYQAVLRAVGEIVNPRLMLASTLLAAGAGTVVLLVTRSVLTQSGPFDEMGPISQVLCWTFALFFLPMFGLGMVSPQVIRLAVPDVAHVGRVAGRVYAWSTAGAIAGTFAAGYVLLSAAGMDRTILGASLILTLTSLLVARVWEYNSLLYVFSIVLGGVCGGFILTLFKGDPSIENGERQVARVETNYYTIVVKEELDRAGNTTGVRKLHLDALLHSTVNLDDSSFLGYEHEHIQVEFLWAARALNPQPRALVIGGGGYTFQRYAMEVLPETRMDVVEIDPGVTRVAHEYLGLKSYDGMTIVHMDGRQFVSEKAAPGSYDLVVQDAVNDLSVPSHLLTKEYNDAVKRTLRPDGTYLLTVIDSLKHGRLWRSALRTLRESFPNVEVICSDEIPPEVPPPDASEDDRRQWQRRLKLFEENRQVLVIYASDRPLNEDLVRTEAFRRMNFGPRAMIGAANGAVAIGGVAHDGVGAAVGALSLGVFDTAFFTHPIPAERLKPFLAADPGVLLTDQFAPVDNLMADVFRHRNRQ